MRLYKLSRFWLTYFLIRLFYLFFTVLVYARLTTLGDTARYLRVRTGFSSLMFFSSTVFMDYTGGLIGAAFQGNMILANLPFAGASFLIVRWVIETLDLKNRHNKLFLVILISLPNFCIWTSVCSKEVFGLAFSAVFAVLYVNFLRGNYKLRIRDALGLWLGLMFKPQYLPFILQGLLFIYMADKLAGRNPGGQVILGLIFLCANILFLYAVRSTVNAYAGQMYRHFDLLGAQSTRANIFLKDGDFYRYAPYGMFIAFFGPLPGEMLEKSTHLIAGIESLWILLFFAVLSRTAAFRLLLKGRLSPLREFTILIVCAGICFVHYPFGIFNPGSAIRYRTNFIFLFIVLLLYFCRAPLQSRICTERLFKRSK
jgi:hypothetical protein